VINVAVQRLAKLFSHRTTRDTKTQPAIINISAACDLTNRRDSDILRGDTFLLKPVSLVL
jgi:hypothetical protein